MYIIIIFSVHKGCISSSGRCKQPPLVCDRYLAEFNWFVGTMDRDNATSKLENRRVGKNAASIKFLKTHCF